MTGNVRKLALDLGLAWLLPLQIFSVAGFDFSYLLRPTTGTASSTGGVMLSLQATFRASKSAAVAHPARDRQGNRPGALVADDWSCPAWHHRDDGAGAGPACRWWPRMGWSRHASAPAPDGLDGLHVGAIFLSGLLADLHAGPQLLHAPPVAPLAIACVVVSGFRSAVFRHLPPLLASGRRRGSGSPR